MSKTIQPNISKFKRAHAHSPKHTENGLCANFSVCNHCSHNCKEQQQNNKNKGNSRVTLKCQIYKPDRELKKERKFVQRCFKKSSTYT